MDIANSLSVSRTAVWKAVNALKTQGYPITSVPNGGYLLNHNENNIITEYDLTSNRNTTLIGSYIKVFDELDSTNNYLKTNAPSLKDGTVIVANAQKSGRGRRDKSFYSPKNHGIYLSILLKKQIHISQINLLTIISALAVTDAIEELAGERPQIKWPNDIYLNGKKVCGILTECSVEGESGIVEFAVVGIGVNVTSFSLPKDLKDIAISLEDYFHKTFNKTDLILLILKHLEAYYFSNEFLDNSPELIQKYKKDVFLLSKKIKVIYPTEITEAVALDIDDKGGLVILNNNTKSVLYSGEVSVQL